MKIFDNVLTGCKKVASKAKELAVKAKDKALALIVGAGATFGTSSANAAITIDDTGIHGSIDTVYYLTAVGIVVSFLAVALSIGYGIRALRKG